MTYIAPIRGGLTPAEYYAAANKGLGGKIYNVEHYGAVHDGSTDDTASIQATIAAADAAGGGVIYFPIGIYVIGGEIVGESGGTTYNSQLTIPILLNNSTLRKTFHFLGEVSPNMDQSVGMASGGGGNAVPPSTGVILKSTIVGDAADQSVICAGNYLGTTNLWTTGNANYIVFENIQIHPVVNGDSAITIGGINLRGALCAHVKNVCCYPFNLLVQSTATPINNCIAIAMPQANSGNHNVVEHCTVGGFETGYLSGDHTVYRDTVAMSCLNGYKFASNYQINLCERIGSYWCKNDIAISGICYINIVELQTEWAQEGKWYDAAYVVLDAANKGHGEIHYNITEANVGFNNARFNKSGGVNLQCIPIGFAAASSFTVSGARDDPEGALASLITALAAKGIIIDSTTAS